MLTKNTDKLRQEVAAHVAADSIVQGIYWDEASKSGCWIGCLAHNNNPALNETTYGLPVMVQRIAENIFERLPADEANKFFAALPGAVNCDGKNLTNVGWQFLAAELRSLPKQPAQIQAVIDPVITGMDLLASGQEWAAATATAATAAAAAAAAATAATAATAAAYAAYAAANDAAATAAYAAAATAAYAAAYAAYAAATATATAAANDAATTAAAYAAANDAAYADAARLRQRDLLLRLISEAPVMEALPND
jgi:hypothetical protein